MSNDKINPNGDDDAFDSLSPADFEALANKESKDKADKDKDNKAPAMKTDDDSFVMDGENQTVTPSDKIFVDRAIDDDEFVLPLPSRITPTAHKDIYDATEEQVAWDTVRTEGYAMSTLNYQFVEALDSGTWKGGITLASDDKERLMKMKRQRVQQNPDAVLTGADVSSVMRAFIGEGGLVLVPLVSSGFWVAIEAPKESDTISLFTEILNTKINTGRRTYGSAYSNDSVYIYRAVFKYCLQHIRFHTIKGSVKISKLIRTSDLHLMFTAIVAAIYPKGHPYTRACDDGPNKCFHVKQGVIDLMNTIVIKDELFTDEQKAHMFNTEQGSMSVESVKAYQEGFIKRMDVVLKGEEGMPDINVTLEDSYAEDFFTYGSRWISNIENMAMEALGVRDDGSEDDTLHQRAALMDQLVHAAALMEHAHFVSGISGAFGKVKANRTNLNEALEAMSSSAGVRDQLLKHYEAFMETLPYVIGIPNYVCPSCNKESSDKGYFIPLDVLRLFYWVLGTRILLL